MSLLNLPKPQKYTPTSTTNHIQSTQQRFSGTLIDPKDLENLLSVVYGNFPLPDGTERYTWTFENQMYIVNVNIDSREDIVYRCLSQEEIQSVRIPNLATEPTYCRHGVSTRKKANEGWYEWARRWVGGRFGRWDAVGSVDE